MAFLEKDEIQTAYTAASDEARVWRENYPEFERLADNGLLDDLDESLPEVNDGSLAASLFKLPKRIVNSDLSGTAKAVDSDDSWVTELANIEWEQQIIPNANSQAPFDRKWKDAVRKAAIYGGIPLITLFHERGNYTGSDFIVAQAQDVKLEAGKVSDYDSDIIFWDVYYSRSQLATIIEQAKEELKDGTSVASKNPPGAKAKNSDKETSDTTDPKTDPVGDSPDEKAESEAYNIWDVVTLQDIYDNHLEEERPADEENRERQDKAVKRGGYHFYISFQRGVEAPFDMMHKDFPKNPVRQWSNPDPTGDVPVHYLYCYQDFVNPYGIGIVKLAGGTQNVLDYMRQADVKATQLGIEPPIDIGGDTDDVDFDSFVYEQKAQWMIGNATVKQHEIANGIYEALPGRISMYQTSLQKLIPSGDTTISGGDSGDPQYSKTPAGVKQQVASLSIDDEDFKDNLYVTFGVVAKSMINTHFANMQGSDIRRLSDENRDILIKAGLQFPQDPQTGQPLTNELDVIWEEARATFDFTVDAEQDKTKDDEQKLNGLLSVAKFAASDPNFDAYLLKDGKKLNRGELFADIIGLTSDNEKIIEDISPEDKQQAAQQQQNAQGQGAQKTPSESITFKDAVAAGATDAAAAMLTQAGLPSDDLKITAMQAQAQPAAGTVPGAPQSPAVTPAQSSLNNPEIQSIAKQYGVAPNIAAAMLAAEQQGYDPKEIIAAATKHNQLQKQAQRGAIPARSPAPASPVAPAAVGAAA